jgi:hypothetical protein
VEDPVPSPRGLRVLEADDLFRSFRDKSAKREELSGGDRALPAIRPRSHEPVDDSDKRDRLPRLGAYLPGLLGLLALGMGRGSREELVGDSDMLR